MATTLTQSQIILYAGKRAANESLATFCEDWLNNIIDTLGQNYKWPELERNTTGTLTGHGSVVPVTADVVSLPADFGDLFDVHSLRIIDTNGTVIPLTPQTTEWYDTISSPLIVGVPNSAVFDLDAKTWTPFPLPQLTYTWTIRYRIKPDRLFSDTTIPFASDEIFIQALYVQILQYEDDQRFGTEYTFLQKLIKDHIGGYNKGPIKSKSMRLNSDAFRRIQNQR